MRMPEPSVVPALVQAGPRIVSSPRNSEPMHEQIDAARDHAEPSVMQDHPAIGVIGRRAGIGDGQIGRVGRELGRRRRAEERVDRARRRAGESRAHR